MDAPSAGNPESTTQSQPVVSVGNTSGQGKAAVIPNEIKGWNWGAFLLNWIWGLGNETYIALLMFVPFVNIVMVFMLGARGNAWAWRNRHWESVERFKQVQRKWTIAGLIVLGAGVVFFIVAMVGLVGASRLLLNSVKEPVNVADAFIADVSAGSIGQAYALMDSEYRANNSQDEFVGSLDPILSAATNESFNDISVVNREATLKGTITDKDGSTAVVTINEIEENGNGMISGVTLE